MSETPDERPEVQLLFSNIKNQLSELTALLTECKSGDIYDDRIYRFYHQSYKVYYLQHTTLKIVDRLKLLLPEAKLNPWFMRIVAEGTGKEFDRRANAQWLDNTRPIVEAFFHAVYFLEMAIKSGREMHEPENLLPSGWAALLHLYNLR